MQKRFTYIWEFIVLPELEAEFLKHYGPEGNWVYFFNGFKCFRISIKL